MRPARLAVLALVVAGTATLSQVDSSSASVPPVAGHGSPAASAIAAARAHSARTHAGPDQEFRAVDTITDRSGRTHVRLQRSYRDLQVLGGDLVVHQSATGAWQGSSQTLRSDLHLSTHPVVSAAAAARKAVAHSKGRTTSTKVVDKTLLVDATGAAPRLAWRIVTGGTRADGTPSRLESYVDARTGEVLRTEETIETVDGTGHGLYEGTVPLQLTLSGSTYQLKDPTRGGTYTTDMENASDGILCTLLGLGCSSGTLFTSPDSSFGTGSASSRESAAVDAQYGTNMTWDFYKSTYGRNGIFGDGTGSYNRVHYGNGYDNAFWDGSKMTYGDGDGVSYGPFTSLDVTGHEMSHGVTENTAGLNYSGEPGGLNESTSDIFGTMVEFYAQNPNDPGDYLIGEEFDLQHHAGFRRMDHPSAADASLDCWSSKARSVDVHYSSGIGNHFFYLLAEGSGAKTINGVNYDSPTCDGSTVTGIGRDKAAAIWYRALTTYFTSNTNYAGARTATLQAAGDLYGTGGPEYDAVAAAWSAVDVS
jgi:Zn-dependent metalloprotease